MWLVVTSKRFDGVWRCWIQKGETRVAFATAETEAMAIKAAKAAYKAGKQ